jgi:predicted GIY-YIG superfamily endonuclease
MAKKFFTYLMLFEGGYLYTGATGTPHRRLRQHGRERATVIWRQCFKTREEAILRERQLKGWSRDKKLALASSDIEALIRLSSRRAGRPLKDLSLKPRHRIPQMN